MGGGAGGTHILRHTGMCCSHHKKSLNMGPNFYKNIPKHGSVFSKSKHPKIVKMGLCFKKNPTLKMGTFSAK